MKVISVKESVELCTESGWSAYDMTLDAEMDRDTIIRLGSLGDLTYLEMLKPECLKGRAGRRKAGKEGSGG